MIELKPCPFCGSKDVGFVKSAGGLYVGCKKCGACGAYYDSEEFLEAGAAKAWNRRAKK